MKRVQDGELLGDGERGVVAKHDTASPDAHRRRSSGQVRNQHCGDA
jgi:hypothetical protein